MPHIILKKNSSILLCSFIIIFTLINTSCATSHKNFPKNIGSGITYEYFDFSNFPKPNKKLLRYHLLSIDLTDPTIKIVSQDDMTNQSYNGKTTHKFAKQSNAAVAINGTLFYYPKGKLSLKRGLLGLCIVNGKEYSKPKKSYAALLFVKDPKTNLYKAHIISNQEEPLPNNTEFAIGGFFTIIKDKQIIHRKTPIDSRTACGISNNGNTLHILCVEGEDLVHSPGLTFDQCAKILLDVGCETAMQLDGGGSTSLIINGKNALTYWKPRSVAHSFGFSYK